MAVLTSLHWPGNDQAGGLRYTGTPASHGRRVLPNVPNAEKGERFKMRRILVVLSGVIGLLTVAALPAFAQPSDDLNTLRKDVDALKEGQKSIQSDLQELKNLLQQRARPAAPPQEATVSIDGAVVIGDKNAKVTLVDFTDYQ